MEISEHNTTIPEICDVITTEPLPTYDFKFEILDKLNIHNNKLLLGNFQVFSPQKSLQLLSAGICDKTKV